ncbi:MAG TPA: acetyltransferase [Blastocatellia bacterium]|nr:acetyltransferase [Blastocatellia bacterium]
MQSTEIAIYGGGGFARELAWLIESCNVDAEVYRIVCFIDDNEANQGKVLNTIPVTGLDAARERFPNARVVGGVGTPLTRQRVTEKAAAAGFEFETIIHPRVERSRWIEIGLGTVICAGNILTTNIALGQHVQLNLDCTIGHDVIIGDYTTLAPGVHISGWVHFGKRVYVGTGAVLINGVPESPLTIGDDAVIGAGACVTKPVAASVTVVGVPAKPLRRE